MNIFALYNIFEVALELGLQLLEICCSLYGLGMKYEIRLEKEMIFKKI